MWLRSNKLSLNIQNSSLVIFHPPQKKIPCDFQLILENKCSNQEKCIKYFSVFIDFKFVMEITILQPLFYRKPVFCRKELFALWHLQVFMNTRVLYLENWTQSSWMIWYHISYCSFYVQIQQFVFTFCFWCTFL